MAVSANPDEILVAHGLGSCVAICLYDPLTRVGGLLHALLSTPVLNHKPITQPTKYVDRGIPCLIDALVTLGANPTRLVACLAGGARVLTASGFEDSFNIGRLNVQTAKTILHSTKLKIRAEATGGHKGRTVKLYLANGQVSVKMSGQPEQILTRLGVHYVKNSDSR